MRYALKFEQYQISIQKLSFEDTGYLEVTDNNLINTYGTDINFSELNIKPFAKLYKLLNKSRLDRINSIIKFEQIDSNNKIKLTIKFTKDDVTIEDIIILDKKEREIIESPSEYFIRIKYENQIKNITENYEKIIQSQNDEISKLKKILEDNSVSYN